MRNCQVGCLVEAGSRAYQRGGATLLRSGAGGLSEWSRVPYPRVEEAAKEREIIMEVEVLLLYRL